MKIIPKFECKLVRSSSAKYGIDSKRIKDSDDACEFARRVCCRILMDCPNERFIVLTLSTKNEVIGWSEITAGTLDASLIHPREVFRPAILQNASTVILVHNHPSGDTTPSKEDFAAMNRLTDAGKLLGIDVLDSIICGADSAISMRTL